MERSLFTSGHRDKIVKAFKRGHMFYGFLIMETNNKDVKPHCSGGKKL